VTPNISALDGSSQGSSPDALQQILTEAHQRFVATFGAQCDSIDVLVDKVAALGAIGPVAALTQVTHRLRGLAGTIGFPTISARASELEDLVAGLGDGTFDTRRARDVVHGMREAFATDLAAPPAWMLPAPSTAPGTKILVAQDERDQPAVVTASLERAGYLPIPVWSGDRVLDMARAENPALILLDLGLSQLDGCSTCRLLKADPELAEIPVVVMTTGASLDDKLAGLTLGADEFLSKPVDMRELLLRIELLLKRNRSHQVRLASERSSRELTYDAFLAVAGEEIARTAVALAVVRLPTEHHADGSRLLIEEVRGRDAVGVYGQARSLILMPEMTAVAASERLEAIVDRLVAHGLDGICAGVTAAAVAGTTAETLIAEADEALAEARYLGSKTAIWSARAARSATVPAARTIVIAEDDPDVTRIVDAQVRASGYKTIIAFDGEQALDAVRQHVADVVVLDLMMPKRNGFDVLAQIRQGAEPQPKVIVLTGRGREQDVLRAFELGANDYMTKPFNPQELMARIARLLA
jgi:DNA-binding response OmpR family regulator/HPt (histidine-containing phosphotransfer) domain-containing protein